MTFQDFLGLFMVVFLCSISQTATIPRPTRRQLQEEAALHRRDNQDPEEPIVDEDAAGTPPQSNSENSNSWNDQWSGKTDGPSTSRRNPVHTYGRAAKTRTQAQSNDAEAEWPTGRDEPPRKRRNVHATRTRPSDDEDDDVENNPSSQLDPIDAAVYKMAENNEINLLPPRSMKRGGRTAQTTRAPPSEDEESEEEFEKCFLCNKLIPKAEYQAHVNDEVDRMNNGDSIEGAVASLDDPETGLVRRKRRIDEVAPARTGNQRSAQVSPDPEIIDDSSHDEDDSDEQLPFNPVNVSFGDSPIKAYRKISEQTNSLIDFKNQFKTEATSSRGGSSMFKVTGRGKGKSYRGKKGRRGRGRGRGKRK